MSLFRLIIIFCALLIVPQPVLAQGHSAFCGQVDSTAASQGCLKRHLESAQKKLNKVYLALSNQLEGEKLQELKDLQSTWLNYRDMECMWESERAATSSLKRINELSCMARVTEDRADLLTIAYADSGDVSIQREFGSFPRWMNALAKDHPNVYWNYGHRPGYDLDCDGEDEFVMAGVTTAEYKKDTASDTQSVVQEMIVSVTQNPTTGRPTADIFKFLVGGTDGKGNICGDHVGVEFGKHTPAPVVEGELKKSDQAPACLAYLQINQKNCEPKIVSWNGKNFAIEVEAEESKVEEKKK